MACSTFGRRDLILVPSPAARTMTAAGRSVVTAGGSQGQSCRGTTSEGCATGPSAMLPADREGPRPGGSPRQPGDLANMPPDRDAAPTVNGVQRTRTQKRRVHRGSQEFLHGYRASTDLGGPVKFTETRLAGAFIIDLERREDSRGYFARTFCQHEFAEHGLKTDHRAGQRRAQPRQGHPARDALPVPAQAGDQAGAGHAGRRRRHHRRPAPREPDVPRARQRRADRGQRPSDLRPGALRPRVPDAGRRHRDQLPGRRVLRARDRGRFALRRPATRAHLAAAGGDDVRQGPGLDPARRVRARAEPREDGV